MLTELFYVSSATFSFEEFPSLSLIAESTLSVRSQLDAPRIRCCYRERALQKLMMTKLKSCFSVQFFFIFLVITLSMSVNCKGNS